MEQIYDSFMVSVGQLGRQSELHKIFDSFDKACLYAKSHSYEGYYAQVYGSIRVKNVRKRADRLAVYLLETYVDGDKHTYKGIMV